MSWGCGSIPGEGVLGRQGFRVRECFTPPGSELAAVVTRSHPASLLGTDSKADARTDGEQISQTARQTEAAVLIPMRAKLLKSLVGAPGLEPGTR